MTDADIRSEVANAMSLVDNYWTHLFSTWHNDAGGPIQWYTPQLYNGDGFYDSRKGSPTCGDESLNGSGASFCRQMNGSGWMAWDIATLREFVGTGNNTALYMVVAHETAHAAQWRFIWDGEARETQADCIAGVTLGTARNNGDLQIEPGDENEIWELSKQIGDHNNDHGTPEERYGQFMIGYNSADIEQCLGNRSDTP
jgi:predicted metalloprotease